MLSKFQETKGIEVENTEKNISLLDDLLRNCNKQGVDNIEISEDKISVKFKNTILQKNLPGFKGGPIKEKRQLKGF